MNATDLDSIPWVIPTDRHCFWCQRESVIKSIHYFLPDDNPKGMFIFQLCAECDETIPFEQIMEKIHRHRSGYHEVVQLDGELREVGTEQFFGKTRLMEN